MIDDRTPPHRGLRVLHWAARVLAVAAIVPLMLILLGESGTGPAGVREWLYLALFPIGFSAGYLMGWRWPLAGGLLSLVCMALSLVVIGRAFETEAYMYWALLCVPGLLFLLAGWSLRRHPSAGSRAQA